MSGWRWAGRVLAPLWVVLAAVAAVAFPVLAAIAAVAGLLTGRRQPWLAVRFALHYLVREATVLVASAGLWVLAGAGRRLGDRRFVLAHYRLVGWFVRGLVRPAFAALDLKLDLRPSAEAERALASRRPLLVFSRHAGPGDSAVILDVLLNRYRRLPRIVLKERLTLDPLIGLVCRRLPMTLIGASDGDDCERDIADLARTMDAGSVVLLFPEGGNFTAERRGRAIARLLGAGHSRQARRAQRMRHVVAPRTGGAIAALAAAPDADVVFTAHTGLGNEVFASQLWRRLPEGRTLTLQMWLAPASERPTGDEALGDWLYGWWQRLDEWIEAQHTE